MLKSHHSDTVVTRSVVVTPLRDRLPNALGRITTTGQVSEVFIPSPPAQASLTTPLGLTVGPDNALWFGIHVGQIGRFAIG